MSVSDVVGGRFVLCDQLARAGTGTVWRAWDLRHGRYCAAKLVRRRDGGDALRFAWEQGVRLRHPHLLTPYTWVADGGRVLIASPLADGGSLRAMLDEYGPLAAPTAADLLDQLLDGLAHLHAAGVAHRGVGPATLLLDATYTRAPRLRLAGFGRAGDGDEAEAEADLLAAGEVAAEMLREGTAPGRLGAVVAALRAADPRDRPTARGAREALRAQPAEPPRTAAGDRVVLLDRLPGLPPGWTTEGPASAPPSPTPAPAPPPTQQRPPAAEPAGRPSETPVARTVDPAARSAPPAARTPTPAAQTRSPDARSRDRPAESGAHAAEPPGTSGVEPGARAAGAPGPPGTRAGEPPGAPADEPAAQTRSPGGRSRDRPAEPGAHAAEPPGTRGVEPGARAAGAAGGRGAEPGARAGEGSSGTDWPTLTVGAGAAEADADAESGVPPVPGRRRGLPEHAKGRRAPPEHAAARHPHRRPAAVAAATVLVLAAAGTVIARTGDRPAPAPPRTTTPSQPAGSVAAGAPCDWQREGDAEIGAGGQALRCVLTGDGYRWTAG